MERISGETLLGFLTTSSSLNSSTAAANQAAGGETGERRFPRVSGVSAVAPDYAQQVPLLLSLAVNRFRLETPTL